MPVWPVFCSKFLDQPQQLLSLWMMGNMDGQAHPNVAVQPGLEQVHGCRCSAEYCQRLMGGGGHIVSAPTNQKGASRASVEREEGC